MSGARDEVLAALRDRDRFLLVTHENPDGDALGSLVAMQELLQLLDKDSCMFVSADELPLPYEYRFFPTENIATELPADAAERIVVFLDCGNVDRNPAEELRTAASRLNIDHHHDNTGFGTVNHVVPEASCTAEIVWDLMRALEVEPTTTMAEALYVGLVTDTGKFMYENTGTRAHEMAASLIQAGVDVHGIYRRIYEGIPFGKLALLARGLDRVERFDDGALTLTRIEAQDFVDAGAEESWTEGVIDHLRSVAGTRVAAVVRDRLGNGNEGRRKVSLRSADDAVDVSSIARAQGGGGHRQAAGFTTTLDWPELVEFLRGEVAAQA